MSGVAQLEDGRRRRSDQSRKLIVQAMIALVTEGHVSPGAAQVAERAGVGLRSVFRHFEDMETLYREMAEATSARIMPMILRPYEAAGWRARLEELVARRIEIYEDIMPLKVAASVLRFRSPYLMEDYRRHLKLERMTLEAILPGAVKNDPVLMSSVEMATSFQAWRRLRQDQMLGAGDARKVLDHLLDALIGKEGDAS